MRERMLRRHEKALLFSVESTTYFLFFTTQVTTPEQEQENL